MQKINRDRVLGVKILIVLAAIISLLALACTASAQTTGFVESYNTISDSTTPQVDIYAKGPIKGKLGWTVWSLSSKGWSEGHAGLTFAPAGWMELSGSLGIETDENPLRGSVSFWVGKGRLSYLSIHEHGGSGYWFRHLATFEVTKTFFVGVNSTRFLGTGPYIEKKFGKVSFWGTYAVGDDKGVIGARFNF